MFIAYLVYWVKFVRIRKHLKVYNGRLKKLKRMYEKELYGEDGGDSLDDVDSGAKRKAKKNI